MNEANKKARRPAGYKPFWESDEDTSKQDEPSRWVDWFKKRIIGEKTAAETATEELEELKKKKNGI